MFTSFYSLNENPFSIAPDPLYLFMSERHREALAHLQYGVRSDGGFVLLTGEVGTGKTTLCRRLLEKLPPEVDVAYILNPKLSAIELLETICHELRIQISDPISIKVLIDHLNAYLLNAHARGRRTVLIIDEAQNLSAEVLEQLRLLTNLETNRYKLLQIILLGQPELLQILGHQKMRQLSQRITARFHLGPLDESEIMAYVRHRLKIAGCERPLFPDNLAKRLWKLSGGLPRLINLICERSLLGSYAKNRQEVDLETLAQAAREVLGDNQPPVSKQEKTVFLKAVWGSCILLGLVVAVWLWNPTEKVLSFLSGTQELKSSGSSQGGQIIIAAPIPDEPPQAASQDSLPRAWPGEFAVSQDKESAFADLAALWGLTIDMKREDYCSFAREQGFECLAEKGSLEMLRQMNRPALLTMYRDDGLPFYVVMASLEGNRALFVAGDEQYEVDVEAIATRWFGNYLMLWQKPPIDKMYLKPGEQSDSVLWLAKTLEELKLYQATGQEKLLDGSLLGAFKFFQFSQGLTPDGVMGPMSLIHLNTARNVAGPRLKSQGSG